MRNEMTTLAGTNINTTADNIENKLLVIENK